MIFRLKTSYALQWNLKSKGILRSLFSNKGILSQAYLPWPSSTLGPITVNKGITQPPRPPLPLTKAQDLRTSPYLPWNTTPPFIHSKPSNIWGQLTDSNSSTPTSSCAKKHSCYLFRSTFVLFVCLLFNIVNCAPPPSYRSQSRCGFHIQWVCCLCCTCGYLLLLHLCSGSTVVWIINSFIRLTCSLGQKYGQGRAECVC